MRSSMLRRPRIGWRTWASSTTNGSRVRWSNRVIDRDNAAIVRLSRSCVGVAWGTTSSRASSLTARLHTDRLEVAPRPSMPKSVQLERPRQSFARVDTILETRCSALRRRCFDVAFPRVFRGASPANAGPRPTQREGSRQRRTTGPNEGTLGRLEGPDSAPLGGSWAAHRRSSGRLTAVVGRRSLRLPAARLAR